ncbi:MAG: NTP transferase domain-containing protein [Flavobacteriales bacterium]
MSHGKLDKKERGRFYSKELAIYGTTCNQVSELFLALEKKTNLKLAYIDGDHSNRDAFVINHIVIGESDTQIQLKRHFNEFDFQFFNSEMDAVVVNGNHFEASKQLIVFNPEKEKSLEKRKGQLTEIIAFYCDGKKEEAEAYFNHHFPELENKILLENEDDLILWFVKEFAIVAPIKGLILAGGMSTRMGSDKSKMKYHNTDQVEHISNLMKDQGLEVFISCREDQKAGFLNRGFQVVTDKMMGVGPMAGMCSAWMQESGTAWLAIAVDMPLINESSISQILSSRDASKYATCFMNEEKQWPEPLFTIWEPRAYQRMMQFISIGISCPRKVLMNSDVKSLQTMDQRILINANSPEDAEMIKKILQ